MKSPYRWLMIGLVVLVVCTFWGSGGMVLAQGGPTATPPPPQPSQSPSPDEVLMRAELAVDKAEQSVDFANSLMALIQSISDAVGLIFTIVGGALAIVGTILGAFGVRTLVNFNNARRRFEEGQKNFEESRAAFESTRAEFATTNAQFEQTKRAFEQEMDEAHQKLEEARAETERIRKRGDNAINALTMLHLGKQQMDAQNFDAALITLLEAYGFDPDNRAINWFLGELHIQLDKLDEALEYLIRAGAEQATTGVDGGSFAAAKAAYAHVWRKKGDLERANIGLRNDYYRKAEMYFLEALKKNPKLLDIHGEAVYNSLGGLYKQEGKFDKAVECYVQAISVRPTDSSYPYNNLGILFTQLHDDVQAAKYFALSRDIASDRVDDRPQDYWARFDLVTAYTMLNDANAVDKHLREAFKYAPTTDKLRTFLRGLYTLNDAKSSDLLRYLINEVTKEIERREQSSL